MANILKYALSLGLALGLAGFGAAQPGPGDKPGWQQRDGRNKPPFSDFGKGILSKLDLTPAQREKIKKISEPRLAKLRELHETPMIPTRRHERAKALVREMQQEIQNVLTVEQRERMKEMLKEARKRGPRGRGGPPPAQ